MRDEDQNHRDKQREFLDFETFADDVIARSKVHPGLAESLVPVWGPARDAVAYAQEGNVGGAALNAGLAVVDGVGGWEIGRGVKIGVDLAKVAKTSKAPRPFSYREMGPAIRKHLGAKTWVEQVHHAIIPQKWKWPDRITNHPLNLKVLPTKTHQLIHGNARGGAKYNWLQGLWHGSPEWTKMTAGSVAERFRSAGQKDEDSK